MKGLNVLAAFLGGAAVGAALGILFAPEKGEDTRHKIAEILRKKGIKLNRNEMENLVDEIAAELNITCQPDVCEEKGDDLKENLIEQVGNVHQGLAAILKFLS